MNSTLMAPPSPVAPTDSQPVAPAQAPPPTPKKHQRTALRIGITLAVLGLALSIFLVASLALFTDTENVGGNVFSTGTVDIAAAPATAVFTPPAMAPGDEVTAPITVSNNGTLDLRYALTSTTTEDALATTLVLTVRVGVTDCSVANWDASGTEIAAPDVLGRSTTEPIFGNVASGAQAGDRALAPTGSEVLCLHVELPLATTSTSEGLTTTATFNFVAEQTKNN